MKFKLLALAGLVAASGSALAESAPYAKLTSVNGLVTVSANSQMTNAKAGMALAQGSQVLVSSTGSANVQFANGCAVFLKPGQSMAVSNAECSSINAQRTSVGVAAGSATGGMGVSLAAAGLSATQIFVLTAVAAAIGVAGLVEIIENDDDTVTLVATDSEGGTVQTTIPARRPARRPTPPISGA